MLLTRFSAHIDKLNCLSQNPLVQVRGAGLAVGSTHVFSARETHGLKPGSRLIAQSSDLGWRSLYAVMCESSPLQIARPAIPHPVMTYHLTRPTEITRKFEGSRCEKAVIRPRDITLTPANTVAHWDHSGRPKILRVQVRQDIYAAAVNEMYGCEASAAPILPRLGFEDPLLEQLCLAVGNALRDGSVRDGLYIDTLAQTIAVRLAWQHSERSRPARLPGTQPIASWKIRRLIDFIEENLDRDLTLEAMATEVSLNSLYLPRAFKKSVGQTPHQYVMRRRIERAKELLAETDLSLSEIAFATGFSDQSHLTRHFRQMIGVAPGQFRRSLR